MQTSIECLPCLGKNAVNIARRLTADSSRQHAIVASALRMLADCDLCQPPPVHAGTIIRQALDGFPDSDPYAAEKQTSTTLAQALVQELRRDASIDFGDFATRLRLAIAGNILDFGVFGDLDIQRALDSIRATLARPVDTAAIKRLQAKMASASRILYLLDNCGEAVFDRVFMEPYRHKTTIAVRGLPAFNDVTRDDLPPSGLGGDFAAAIVEHAGCTPGVNLALAGDAFRKAFAVADLIIAKGQGNFETLNDTDRPTAFLFMAKCPVVIRQINAELNSIQVRTVNF